MQIVIPMSGTGERFKKAGYTVPKFLIDVLGKPIIAHVIDLFPGETDFLFICNEDHLNNPTFKLRKTLQKYCPTGKIVSIAPHKFGPVYAVQQAYSEIKDNEDVLVNYCDFSCLWDFSDFKSFVKETECDGCIPSYRGFHPHMLGPNNYAFIKDEGRWMLDIQEKKPFTDNRMKEFASSGAYYFRSGALLKQYFDRVVSEDLHVNGEFYISMVYRPMVQDGLKVAVYELAHFMQWGTPSDLDEFNAWSSVFSSLASHPRPKQSYKGSLLLPMAGAGARFAAEGYTLPKPLIPVSGEPMVVQATSDLPKMEREVFVLRQDLPGLSTITDSLAQHFPGSRNVVLKELTDGQARTCLLGMKDLPLDEPLTIGACDNGMIYDEKKLEELMKDENTDVIVFGVRGYPGSLVNPKGYGWIRAEGETIQEVSVKIPLKNPARDPVVLGAFTFKKASYFVKAVDDLIASGVRVNGEIYVDSCINNALAAGLRCKLFEVEHYLCWGTPNDLKSFEYWQSCLSKWPAHPYTLEKDSRIKDEAKRTLKARFALTPSPRPSLIPTQKASNHP